MPRAKPVEGWSLFQPGHPVRWVLQLYGWGQGGEAGSLVCPSHGGVLGEQLSPAETAARTRYCLCLNIADVS